jgi:peptidoglycan/xylan/chitin deacetylase (PgdA/CDA1 family)
MFLAGATTLSAGLALKSAGMLAAEDRPALVSITLDLEMSRNFPKWEDTHWDYEKGNLDADTKAYTVEACRRAKAKGGVIHCFCVARVLEQENVDWLKGLLADGHPVGNHTYDHVYLLAQKPEEIQFRFQRAPWLLKGRPTAEVIADNIRMASEAMRTRLGSAPSGFRTPGGFAEGLAGRDDLQRMLLGQGFPWVSSKYPRHANTKPMERPTEKVFASIVKAQEAAQPFVYPSGLVEVPMSPISDIGAFRTGRWPLEDFLEAIRRGVRWAIEHRAVYDFLSHPSCLVAMDPEFRAVELICDLVREAGPKAKLVGLDTIARRFATPGGTP